MEVVNSLPWEKFLEVGGVSFALLIVGLIGAWRLAYCVGRKLDQWGTPVVTAHVELVSKMTETLQSISREIASINQRLDSIEDRITKDK